MKKSTVIFALALAAAFLAACSKQALSTTYDKQITNIENFISNQMKSDTNATLTKNNGAYRLTLHDTLKLKDSLRRGGKVSLYYACFILTSSSISTSNLVSTNLKLFAQRANWDLTDTTRYKLDTVALDGTLVKGLDLGLEGVQEGDEGYILFTGERGFGNTERGTIPARSALVYAIWIDKIFNE